MPTSERGMVDHSKIYPAVIEWRDSIVMASGWQTPNTVTDVVLGGTDEHISIGFVIEQETAIVIMQSYRKDGQQYSNMLRIPRASITKITKLYAAKADDVQDA